MAADISADVRDRVAQRSGYCCEYCLIPQRWVAHKHEPDHIVPRQHGGDSVESNLALACMRCSRFKGPNVGSFDLQTGDLVPFFNPRSQSWADHFAWDGPRIQPLTPEGRVTERILRLNDADRLQERGSLMAAGVYF